MHHLGGKVEVLEALLAFHRGNGEGRGIPRGVRGLALLHLLRADYAARAHLVCSGVDALGAAARTVTPLVAPLRTLSALLALGVLRPAALLLALLVAAAPGLLLWLTAFLLLGVLRAFLRLLAFLLCVLRAVSVAPALTMLAAAVLLLLRAALLPLAALLLCGLPARHCGNQLLQKSKCHMFPLIKHRPHVEGLTFRGGPSL